MRQWADLVRLGDEAVARGVPYGDSFGEPPQAAGGEACPACGGSWLDLARHLLFAHREEVVLWLP